MVYQSKWLRKWKRKRKVVHENDTVLVVKSIPCHTPQMQKKKTENLFCDFKQWIAFVLCVCVCVFLGHPKIKEKRVVLVGFFKKMWGLLRNLQREMKEEMEKPVFRFLGFCFLGFWNCNGVCVRGKRITCFRCMLLPTSIGSTLMWGKHTIPSRERERERESEGVFVWLGFCRTDTC